jgi:hypothetical protein
MTQGHFSGRGIHHALWFFTIDLRIHRDLNQLRDMELQPLAKASNQKT